MITSDNLTQLQPVGLFADRPSIQEALDFAQELADAHPEQAAVILTAVYILFNTIADKYYLLDKDCLKELTDTNTTEPKIEEK